MINTNSDITYVIIENDILKNNELTSTDKITYAYIQYYSNNSKGYCFLTIEQLAEKINITYRQLQNIINKLIKFNYIVRVKTKHRVYLMPTVNNIIRQRDKQNESKTSLFSYNWLEDDE